MQDSGTFRFDQLPNSPYAQQLRAGFGWLRFNPPLEAEFVRFHLRRVLWRVRVWHSLTLALGLVSLLRRLLELDAPPFNIEIAIRVLVLVPISAGLAYVAWAPRFRERYLAVLLRTAPAFYLVSMMLAAQVAGEGRITVLLFPALSLIAAGLLIGALFWQAMFFSALIILAYVNGAMYFGLAPGVAANHVLLLLMVWSAMAVVAYGTESMNRRVFLEQAALSSMATVDGLTGLANRRAFDQHLARTWRQGQREQRPLAVMLVDIDHFKSFNDIHGHQAGDDALRDVAGAIAGEVRRPMDLAARYGGEEFAVIACDLGADDAAQLAEAIRRGVEGLAIPHRGSPSGRVTASIGVALVTPAGDRRAEGMVQLADEALYKAKSSGRNRVVVHASEYGDLETGVFRHPAAG